MSKFTKEMVDSYADKLLIGLTPEENELVLKEFDIIDVTPMTHALDDFEFVLRSDEAEESVPIEDLLRNCDSYEDREIEVPKVVG